MATSCGDALGSPWKYAIWDDTTLSASMQSASTTCSPGVRGRSHWVEALWPVARADAKQENSVLARTTMTGSASMVRPHCVCQSSLWCRTFGRVHSLAGIDADD